MNLIGKTDIKQKLIFFVRNFFHFSKQIFQECYQSIIYETRFKHFQINFS